MKIQIPDIFRFLFDPPLGSVRYRVAYGGRGSGKSHSIAQALVILATQRPLRILCCREVQKSIKDSVKRLLDDKIEACGLGWFFTSTDAEIRGINGSLFLFAGLRTNPDSVKSTEGIDIAWIEEAQTVSQNSLGILTPTIRKPGSELWFSYNPRYDNDPVDSMFRGGEPPPGTIIHCVNYTENPWFPDVLRDEMEWDKRRDYDKYLHVWCGEYRRDAEARVFKNWMEKDFETPSNARFYFGADWGFSVDPTTLVRCYIDGRTLYIDYEAYKVGCEIDRTPELFNTVPEAGKWPIRADSARPETISYMNKHGFNVVPATKGANSVEDGVEFLKSFDIVVHPRCKNTIYELSMYAYKQDKQTNEVLPILEDKNNHCIDALRYGLELHRRNAPVVAAVGVPKVNGWVL